MDDQIKRKKLLCVDFDGVLHSYMTPWQGADVVSDPPVDGAMEWLIDMELSEDYQVCIYSSRSRYRAGIRAMKEWVEGWMGHVDPQVYDQEQIDATLKNLVFLSQKPPAYLTIDDRAICFRGVFPTIQDMDDFRLWFDKYADDPSMKKRDKAREVPKSDDEGNLVGGE